MENKLNTPKIWFTSDCHISHKNVIKHCPGRALAGNFNIDDIEITHWLPLLKPKTNDEVEIEEADDVEKLMRVFSIENVERNIRTHNRGGIYITFNSGDNVKKNDLFEIKLYNKYYYFEAESIKVIGELLEVQAVETGYWADKLSNLKQDIDLRDIIDIEVFPIKDEAKIKQIHEASCWC